MNYKLFYHPDILKHDLADIPKSLKDIIKRAIEERLAVNPAVFGKPLRQSLKGHRKLRVGDYRVIYRITGASVMILKIGHRRDVYEKVFSRLKWPIHN